MFVPKWTLLAAAVVLAAMLAWTVALAVDRNPLPFPDRNYQVFTAPSPEAKAVVIELLGHHGSKPRFRMDTENVERAIFWDGTIINYSQPEMFTRVGQPAAALGLVVRGTSVGAKRGRKGRSLG
jgi:hypothetical protein